MTIDVYGQGQVRLWGPIRSVHISLSPPCMTIFEIPTLDDPRKADPFMRQLLKLAGTGFWILFQYKSAKSRPGLVKDEEALSSCTP